MKQSEGGHASLCLIHFVCIVMFILGACTGSGVNKASLSSNTNYFFSEESMIQLPMLDLSQAGPSGSESLKLYNRFYGLEFDNTRQYNGYFEVGGRRIWSEIFIPFRPVGSLFLIHGYFDHLGTLKNLIDEGLEKGFAVAVFDLPGHGLSSGNRGAIKSFSDYVEVLEKFINECSGYLPEPYHLISHSTGCSIAYEYLNKTEHIAFGRVVFLAPLVHNAHWYLSSFGYHLARPFTNSIQRVYRKNSSDEQYLAFSRDDPLLNSYLPIDFLDALHTWNRDILGYRELLKPILVIQGAEDIIVDWKYNLDFLDSKIPGLEIAFVEKANHQLINESKELRDLTFRLIFDYIKE